MAKFHFNTETGKTGICDVKPGSGRICPLGGPANHYTTREAAQAAFERTKSPLADATLKKETSLDEETLDKLKKWGIAGMGPDVRGLDIHAAAAAREDWANRGIKKFKLTSETDPEEIEKAAWKLGLNAEFLSYRIHRKEQDEKTEARREERRKLAEARSKMSPTVSIPNTPFEIDRHWVNEPGEPFYKNIKGPGLAKAAITVREGFYILSARDAEDGWVDFPQKQFGTEKAALEHLIEHQSKLTFKTV